MLELPLGSCRKASEIAETKKEGRSWEGCVLVPLAACF